MKEPTTPQLKDGYTKIANKILEQLCKTGLSQYEWRVLMAIFRKTYGFNKKDDWIANSQLVKLTQIHKAHISRTIRKLKNKGIVTQKGNKLSFNKNFSSWLPKEVTNKKLPKQVTVVTQTGNSVTQTGNKSYPKRRTQKKKETIQKKLLQKKYTSLNDLTENELEEIANDYGVPVSFVKSKLDDMENWLGAKGKKYKNYKLALRKWVKTDAVKRIDDAKKSNIKTAIDASSL
jgi:phage replication O-like protein O